MGKPALNSLFEQVALLIVGRGAADIDENDSKWYAPLAWLEIFLMIWHFKVMIYDLHEWGNDNVLLFLISMYTEI